jgi:hypothetical protein
MSIWILGAAAAGQEPTCAQIHKTALLVMMTAACDIHTASIAYAMMIQQSAAM